MTAPAPRRFVVAIDSGSQSTKVLVVDQDGQVHARAQRRLRPYDTTTPGHVLHPDDDLWDSIAATCREALGAFVGDRSAIVGVGLCAIRFCRALLDADGRLVEPVLSWMDSRVSRPHVPEDDPDRRIARITTSSGYLTGRLTGRYRDTVATYQGVWPIDVERRAWSTDEADYVATGMRRDQLAELVEPGDLLGEITAEAGAATGLPEGTPVYATANDKAVEALGSGLASDHEAVLSLGTYIAALARLDGTAAARSGSSWVNFDCRPGGYLLESDGIRRGMWTVSWWRDLLDPGLPGPLSEAELEEGARQVPIGSDGLVAILDWLAPDDHPDRRGALLGFDGRQGRFHVHRALLEGIGFTMRQHLDALQESRGREIDEVIVSGGGARSTLMLSILADILARPVRRTEVADAAGLGAAICALVGAGVWPDWDVAVERTVRVERRVAPDPSGVAGYAPLTERYAGLRSFSDPMFSWLGRS